MMKKKPENTLASARQDELVVQELQDEVLVYDLRNHKAHCLNKTAAFIWHHCDGQTTAEDIAKMMEQEWRMPVTEDAVWFAMNKLSRAELLKQRIVLPEGKAGISRRSAMHRLGLGVLLIPAVMSIVSPTAMAGASIPTVCFSCIKKITGASDCGVCVDTQGACYDNAGCGNGQFVDCRPCGPCLARTGAADTISWQAGANGC